MKCIFCLQEKLPSDEHVIPDSIGGTIHIKEVCHECNSDLSRLVDNPFANSYLIKLARFTHSLGGKRDIVPFPFGGIGTIDTGQNISLDREFIPHLRRDLNISKLPGGGLNVQFNADASDKIDFSVMLGKPLRKAVIDNYPDCPQEQLDAFISNIVEQAKAQPTVSEQKYIKQPWSIQLDDLLFEYMKIAYEMWFRSFGYMWVENSETAKMLRTAILNRDSSLPIQGQLFFPDIQYSISDPSKNHMIVQMDGACIIRLFNISCFVGCEVSDERFKLTEQGYSILIQDFVNKKFVEEKPLKV